MKRVSPIALALAVFLFQKQAAAHDTVEIRTPCSEQMRCFSTVGPYTRAEGYVRGTLQTVTRRFPTTCCQLAAQLHEAVCRDTQDPFPTWGTPVFCR